MAYAVYGSDLAETVFLCSSNTHNPKLPIFAFFHAPNPVGYQAIRGNGGVARLVFLPFEAHGYRGKETIEHVLWEKMTWLNKYVKNAGTSASIN